MVKSQSRNSTFSASILIIFIDCVSNRARATTANGLTTAEWVRDDQKATPERRQTRSPEICDTLTSGGATGSDKGQPSAQPHHAPPVESGYVPASAVPPQVHVQTNPVPAQWPPSREPVSPVNPTPSVPITRVCALHSFEPTETGKLAFERGDIIKVVDRGYKDWWRGQLGGGTGIFPVNYVVRWGSTPYGKRMGRARFSNAEFQLR